MKTSAYSPFEVGTKDRVVGLFVITAVLLFLLGFLIPLLQRIAAEDGVPFYTVLDQTYGIGADSTVSLRGVIVGNVTGVAITKDGSVRIDFKLSTSYKGFYTNGSRLALDTNIGLNTILSGGGLLLMPGPTDTSLLEPGSLIVTNIPQGLSAIFESIDIAILADQITEIVGNIESITTGFNQNQDKIYRTIDNLELVTLNIAEVSKSLPAMTNSINQSLISLQTTIKGMDKIVANTDQNLQPMLVDMASLSRQATATLAETELLFKATTPVLNQLPTFLITTEVTLQSVTELTDLLGQSWLLGGSNKNKKEATGPTSHPHDNSLYNAHKP